MLAHVLRSDLQLPDALYQGLSLYLLLAIGLKGGSALSVTPPMEWMLPGLATLVLGVLTPFIAFFAMRTLAGVDRTNAAAISAHYGSVSAVTFLAALDAASTSGLSAEGFLPALVAILEVPGIIVGLALAGSGSAL